MPRYLLLIITFTASLTQAQEAPEVTNEILNYWQASTKRIKELRRVEEETFELSTDGGKITKYYDGESLILMFINLKGETGSLNRSYCLKNGKLVYVFDEEFRYNAPYYLDSLKATSMGFTEWFDPEKTQLFMGQYYYQEKKLIWYIQDEKAVDRDHPDFHKKEKLYLDELKELK